MQEKMKEIARIKQAVRLQQWSEQVQEQQASGLTIRQWCDDNGIKTNTYYAVTADRAGLSTLTVNSDDREKPEKHEFTVTNPAYTPEMTVDCGGAYMVIMPDDEINVGESTLMTVCGVGYRLYPIIYKLDGELVEDRDLYDEYIEYKETGSSGRFTQYQITAKKPCRVRIRLYLSTLSVFMGPAMEISIAANEKNGDATTIQKVDAGGLSLD